jgi:hypothetical protein
MLETVLYSSKITIIIENNYEQLLCMIEEFDLEQCSESPSESYKNMLKVAQLYYGSSKKINMFTRFSDFHQKYMDYYEKIQDRGMLLCDYLELNMSLILNDNEKVAIKLQHVKDSLAIESVSLTDLCYLDEICKTHPVLVSEFIQLISSLIVIDESTEVHNRHEQYLLYRTYDMFVRLMETNDDAVFALNKKSRVKIFSRWMTMSSPSYHIFSNQSTFPYMDSDYDEKKQVRIRDIVLSRTITNILKNNNYTFAEIGYILSKDRIDMFKIITERLMFKTIHVDLFKYLSPKILTYVIHKSLKVNKNNTLTFGTNISTSNTNKLIFDDAATINIDPRNLIDRSPHEIVEICHILNTTFDDTFTVYYESVANRYGFVECAYVITYWEYIEMCKNGITQNVLAMINSCKNSFGRFQNAHLEFTILRCVLELEKYKILKDNMNEYFEFALHDKTFILSGPDAQEIYNEFKQYSQIAPLEYIQQLQELFDTHEYSNNNNNIQICEL